MSDGSASPDAVAKGSPPIIDTLRPGERAVITELAELKATVSGLDKSNARLAADLRLTWAGLISGFLILAGFFIYGYMRLADQLDQKATSLLITSVRIETKLDDLSQRLPLPSAAPRR